MKILTYIVFWFYSVIFGLCADIGIYGVETEWSHFVLIAIVGIPASIIFRKMVEQAATQKREEVK